jgi:hypothetical protein
VDANNRCSGQGKCAGGVGGWQVEYWGRCETIVLVLFLAVSFLFEADLQICGWYKHPRYIESS